MKKLERTELTKSAYSSHTLILTTEMLQMQYTYVRPILGYRSLLSNTLRKGILLIDAVQRQFTKRTPDMSELTSDLRLKVLRIYINDPCLFCWI